MKQWDYAGLSQMASQFGGPEELLEKIRQEGLTDGRREMLPYIGVAFIVGVIASLGAVAFANRKKEEYERVQQEANAAKKEAVARMMDLE